MQLLPAKCEVAWETHFPQVSRISRLCTTGNCSPAPHIWAWDSLVDVRGGRNGAMKYLEAKEILSSTTYHVRP